MSLQSQQGPASRCGVSDHQVAVGLAAVCPAPSSLTSWSQAAQLTFLYFSTTSLNVSWTSLQLSETQTVVVLFGFDNYWELLLICSSKCWPGYLPSGAPQILAVSPGHVIREPLFSRSLLPLPCGLSSPPLTFPPPTRKLKTHLPLSPPLIGCS